ncbi:MAG TPA: hypothetical protein VNZ57_05100, partial [Longimicrobiales bacterium]|nr:hypothetical protein [Longimicrobiales bacterium]
MAMRTVWLLATILAIAGCAGPREPATEGLQEWPAADAAQPELPAGPASLDGVFAFANADGTELLTLGPGPAPESIAGAICGAGRFPVRYARTQDRNPTSSHRQV